MEAMSFKPDLVVGTFKTGDFRRYVYGLIVDYYADDIEARLAVWQFEVARLINKDAQRYVIHGVQDKKREWRNVNPATHAESFPRIPVTPA